MKKAEWGLDSVVVALNDSNLEGFQDDFTGMMPDMFTWFQTESAVPRITCDSKGNALEFSRNGGLWKKTTTLTLKAPIATKVLCFSRLLKCLRSLYGKQCGPRSDCSYESSLFWVHTVCFYT